MFARALASWIMPDEDNKITDFIYSVTEPLIIPVRALLERIPAVAEMPFDISFMVTFVILIVIQYLLPNSFAF